jgi:hypothetical protein
MRFFQITLEGKGFKIPPKNLAQGGGESPSGQETVIGFFATRVVYARNKDSAIEMVMSRVKREWQYYASLESYSGELLLFLETVDQLNFFRFLTAKPRRGFTFYLDGNDD